MILVKLAREEVKFAMRQVNMLEAKTDLSKLVKTLESGEEDVICIARSGTPIVQMTLIHPKKETERIGVARGKFVIPDDFQRWDEEVVDLFETS